MWTVENRARYDRSKLRYPSDLTDEEWALIGPLIPPAERGGNKRNRRAHHRLAEPRPTSRQHQHRPPIRPAKPKQATERFSPPPQNYSL